jgi:ribosomal protein S12 methylthiotransferase
LQRALVTETQQSRLGQRVRVLVDGPASEHELVLRGRLEGQAPEIDPVVYLTECDPSAITPGSFIEAELLGSRDYDLVARPIEGAHTKTRPLSQERRV